ncbi:MAG: bifunctional metallophosphatase/5'-nucleotidase [Thermoanaerobaculia bacterium]
MLDMTALTALIRTLTLLLLIVGGPLRAATTITLLHVSDYHAHAAAFYWEGAMRGGISRVAGFMERHKRHGALVFNGGDMMNKGAPAWSDKYHCAEWAWFNGLVDAMAFGNHDADYGNADFERCRTSAHYPILSANTLGFERYHVFERKGLRIGVFAIAGSDFPRLVTNAKLTFTDPVSAARDVVDTLRTKERVDAVVMIGHEGADDDMKLAAAVPGIDLIFGSHTHLKRELALIPGTRTWFISPYQYAAYVSVIDMTFTGHSLVSVRGCLAPIDTSVQPDRKIARRVTAMQHDLQSDPAYRDLFVPIAKLGEAMDADALARFTVETMRTASHADVAVSTASSFRQSLPPGSIDLETLRNALPYDNEIITVPLNGTKLAVLLERVKSPSSSEARGYATAMTSIDPQRTYDVAVTDYMTRVSTEYADVFGDAKEISTGLHVRAEVAKRLAAEWPAAP